MDDDDYKVRFEFTLAPTEAEDLASFFHREVGAMREEIMDTMVRATKKEITKKDKEKIIKWCNERITYIENIRSKVISSSKKIERD